MSTFEIETNANEIAASIAAVDARLPTRAREITRHHGQLLLTGVKRRSSLPRTGPPGPRLITGDYNRSWNLRMQGNAFVAVASVGTDRPQARRLEYGFAGVDSIGRRYNQPPYPHARPAVFEIEPQFIAALALVVDWDA